MPRWKSGMPRSLLSHVRASDTVVGFLPRCSSINMTGTCDLSTVPSIGEPELISCAMGEVGLDGKVLEDAVSAAVLAIRLIKGLPVGPD